MSKVDSLWMGVAINRCSIDQRYALARVTTLTGFSANKRGTELLMVPLLVVPIYQVPDPRFYSLVEFLLCYALTKSMGGCHALCWQPIICSVELPRTETS